MVFRVVVACGVLLLASPACRINDSGLFAPDSSTAAAAAKQDSAPAKPLPPALRTEDARPQDFAVDASLPATPTDAESVLWADGVGGSAAKSRAGGEAVSVAINASSGTSDALVVAAATDVGEPPDSEGMEAGLTETDVDGGVQFDADEDLGDEPCKPSKRYGGEGTYIIGTTDAVCIRRKPDVNGWNCTNFQGRAVKVNRVPMSCGDIPMPPKWNGYYYFDVSEGLYAYASIAWW